MDPALAPRALAGMTDGRFRAAWWAILVAALALRLVLFGGFGLGDDPGYFVCYHDILTSGSWSPGRAYDWRFAFWVPVVGFLRVFGVHEWSWVGFTTLASVVNVALAYALARQEWDRATALVAMALMAAFPLEVLSATLFVIDVPLAMWCYAGLWLYRAALRAPSRGRAGALAVLAGVAVLLGYSTKQWALLVGTLFVIEALRRPRETWRTSALCAGTVAAGIAAYCGWQWWRFGDPITDVHVVRKVAIFLPHSWDIVTDYSRMLLLPSEYGSWLGGWYLHATLLLGALLVWRAPRAGRWTAYFLVQLASLSAVPSHRDASGTWVLLVPHIFRYLCFVSIPLCLALAGWIDVVRRWRPAAGRGLATALVAVSVWQAVVLTAPTRDAFGEQRRASALLRARFPDDVVTSDAGFVDRYELLDVGRAAGHVRRLRAETPADQAKEMLGVRDGVVVTGGARLPWYGCQRCAPSTAAFTPPEMWTLVATIDGPITPYRLEPLRVWRVSPDAAEARRLLGERPDGEALLEELLTAKRDALAVEVGTQLLGRAPSARVAVLTGLACARLRRMTCAEAQIRPDAAAALTPEQRRQVFDALVAVATPESLALAAAWLGGMRAADPALGSDGTIAELESGMAAAIANYHAVRYGAAEAGFRAVREDPGTPADRRARADYFHALTLFRQHRVPEAVAESAAYRARWGVDDRAIELLFREPEALREVDPARALVLFDAVATAHPDTYWGREATQQAALLRAGVRP
jgi:hypothetical protein